MRPTRCVVLSVLLLGGAAGAAPGQGAPWVRHTIDGTSRGADGVRLADANGDGLPDIATGWEEGGLIRLYLNPGPSSARRPWPAVTVGRVASPEDAVLVDLDGDGATDVVSATEGDSRAIFVHWAPGERGRFADSTAWTTLRLRPADGQQWMFVLPIDIDGANGPDLVVGSKGDGAGIFWLQAPLDPRDGAAWRLHRLTPAGWVMSLLGADVDRDGDEDVVASDRRGGTAGALWLENPGVAAGRGGAAWQAHRIGGSGRETMFLALEDLDGDGSQEVLAAVKPREVVVLRREGTARGEWRSQEVGLEHAAVGTAKAVALGDVDGDGALDAVLTFEQAEGARSGVVWAPLASGVPDAAALHDISGPDGVKFDLASLLDLDGDGDLDLVTTEEGEGLGVVWYENPARRTPPGEHR